MRSACSGIILGVFLALTVAHGQTTSTSPVNMNFPATAVGSYSDASFMVYGSGMDYWTNYRFYVIASNGFGVSWSPSGPFQSSLMLQLASSTGYQSWCYVRYTPTSPNMIGSIKVQLTLGHPTYALVYEQQMGLNQVLPVQLRSFNASFRSEDGTVRLSWMTLSETANFGFEVQRYASEGGDFTSVPDGFVPGHGTILVPQEYEFVDPHPGTGRVRYRLKQIDLDGAVTYSDPVEVDVLTDVQWKPGVPSSVELSQNYPNPFNPSTAIHYGLPERSHVTLTVFNALGQHVSTLVQGEQDAGYHEVRFNGANLPGGVYFYRMQAGSMVETKKFLMLK